MNTDQDVTTTSKSSSSGFKAQAILFAGMLALALIGMGLTMSSEKGSWEFWVFLLAVYGSVSIYWAWKRARRKDLPVWRMIRAQVLHWLSVLVVLGILVLFERTEIINRESASNVGLLVLSLACFLAGVHFDWMFALLGIVLALMVISIGYLEQYVVWLVMVPVIIAAAWVFFQMRKRTSTDKD
ncbi:hypothetical protein KOR42_03030 [Thalassoglobus neptunius]|uniref:Uncharacterized protein n=1 Tax=Thalassoglobus neptunius TaxID=1938619 RepID=A0A5C5X1P8_9PLAN|nr:hypothetical protein [Thalassoglobus neptunius]TWT56947.1 hypothetical protein KOR42_03030 [Thalassoglobus neptunius]